MAKHVLRVQDITDDPLVNQLQDVGAKAIAGTKTWQKRVNSFTSLAQTIVQLSALFIGLTAGAPWYVIVGVAAVIGVAEVIVQATTKTPVTPNVVDTLVDTARGELEKELERVVDGLPVFRGPTTAGN